MTCFGHDRRLPIDKDRSGIVRAQPVSAERPIFYMRYQQPTLGDSEPGASS